MLPLVNDCLHCSTVFLSVVSRIRVLLQDACKEKLFVAKPLIITLNLLLAQLTGKSPISHLQSANVANLLTSLIMQLFSHSYALMIWHHLQFCGHHWTFTHHWLEFQNIKTLWLKDHFFIGKFENELEIKGVHTT